MRLDLSCYFLLPFSARVLVTGDSGLPINLSGYSGCIGDIFPQYGESAIAALNCSIPSGVSGALDLSFATGIYTGVPPSEHRYFVDATSGNLTERLLEGYFRVLP
jgi:hypothetical protein